MPLLPTEGCSPYQSAAVRHKASVDLIFGSTTITGLDVYWAAVILSFILSCYWRGTWYKELLGQLGFWPLKSGMVLRLVIGDAPKTETGERSSSIGETYTFTGGGPREQLFHGLRCVLLKGPYPRKPPGRARSPQETEALQVNYWGSSRGGNIRSLSVGSTFAGSGKNWSGPPNISMEKSASGICCREEGDPGFNNNSHTWLCPSPLPLFSVIILKNFTGASKEDQKHMIEGEHRTDPAEPAISCHGISQSAWAERLERQGIGWTKYVLI